MPTVLKITAIEKEKLNKTPIIKRIDVFPLVKIFKSVNHEFFN